MHDTLAHRLLLPPTKRASIQQRAIPNDGDASVTWLPIRVWTLEQHLHLHALMPKGQVLVGHGRQRLPTPVFTETRSFVGWPLAHRTCTGTLRPDCFHKPSACGPPKVAANARAVRKCRRQSSNDPGADKAVRHHRPLAQYGGCLHLTSQRP